MKPETSLIAYHESARVVFAYINGYACDSMQLPQAGSPALSKLNAGKDTPFVQSILSDNKSLLTPENLPYAVDVAEKLLSVYCAGTCAEVFYKNNRSIPQELELEFEGHDRTMISKIQSFLQKTKNEDAENIVTGTIVSVFKKLREPEVWKAIEILTQKISEQSEILSRYHIEDGLMQAGIKIQRNVARSGFELGVQEGDDEGDVTAELSSKEVEVSESSPLDNAVKDFLKKIKTDWREDDLNSAAEYLHGVYKKYAQ